MKAQQIVFISIICLAIAIIGINSAYALNASNATAAYHLDSGSPAPDATGNGNSLTLTSTSYVTGRNSSALYLSTTSSTAIMPRNLNGTNMTRTITGWFNLTSTGGGTILRAVNPDHAINILATGQLQFYDGSAETTSFYLNNSPSTLYNKWMLLAFQWDGSKYNIYKNNTLLGSTSSTSQLQINSLGRSGASGAVFVVDELTFFNVTLSTNDMTQIWNGDIYPFNNSPQTQTLTVTAANLVNGSAISGLCLAATGTNTTQNLCNSTGNSITFNTTGIYNITVWDIGSGNGIASDATHYNVSVQDYNFSSTVTLTVNTSQSLLLLTVRQLYTNNTILSFNATNGIYANATISGSVLLPANIGDNSIFLNVTGNYTINVSCTAAALSTSACIAGGVYDGIFVIGVKYGATVLNTFNVNTSNATLGGTLGNHTTTNGTVYVPVVRGYYYNFYASPQDYTIANATLPSNASMNYYNFSVYQAQTLNISFYDEMTRSLLNNKNISFELISDLQAGNYTTSNGTIYFTLLTPYNYTLRYGGVEYPERDYFQTVSAQTYNYVKLYLINFSESGNVLVSVQDTGGDPIEGAIVKLMRYYSYCNCYEVVEMSETSASGQAYFNAQYYEGHYKWSVDYQGSNYFLSSSPEKLVPGDGQTIVTRSFTINLGSNYYESYTAITNVGALCGFNEQTEALTFTWSDNSGLVSRGCLGAEHVVGVHYVSDGTTCVNSGTGSVVLSLNNTNTTRYKYAASVMINNQEYVLQDCAGYLDPAPNNNFGGKFGVFLAGGILVTLILVFSYSAIAVLIISAVGIIFISALGVMTFSTAFITGFAALVFGLAVYFMRS